jgi:hypothetical protein
MVGKPTDDAGVQVLVEPEYRYRVFYRVQGKEVSGLTMIAARPV